MRDVGDGEWQLNEAQRPDSRGVRVALGRDCARAAKRRRELIFPMSPSSSDLQPKGERHCRRAVWV